MLASDMEIKRERGRQTGHEDAETSMDNFRRGMAMVGSGESQTEGKQDRKDPRRVTVELAAFYLCSSSSV